MAAIKLNRTAAQSILVLVFLVFGASAIYAKTPYYHTSLPSPIDPAHKYIFFLHGAIVEKRGANATSRKFGKYEYKRILRTLSSKGFTVISEVRPRGTRVGEYAKKVASQVRRLLSAGVAPGRITVMGFSKGGAITLNVSAMLDEPDVNYVLLAGCGNKGRFKEGFDEFVEKYAHRMKGRVLSLYDAADTDSSSCRRAFMRATGIAYSERKFSTNLGHGLFYSPRKTWVDAAMEWIGTE